MSNHKNIQNSQSLPGSEHKQLGVFIGKWHTTGQVAGTSSTPAAKLDSIDIYEWYAGEFFVIHDADSKMGNDVVKSLEIIGYDPSRKCYLASFFDSTGGSGQEEMRYEDNTWTWRGSNVMGAKEHRCFAVFSEDERTIKVRHEKSDDGVNWMLWIDAIMQKQSK
jgi:hypothetical protein